jgi:hypothetical protein
MNACPGLRGIGVVMYFRSTDLKQVAKIAVVMSANEITLLREDRGTTEGI